MASTHREIVIEASPDRVWSALRDIGAEHRVFPGVLVDSRRDGDHRVVTFAAGMVVRELIVTGDDDRRRLVYTVVESPLGARHHQASLQVEDAGPDRGAARVLWVTDVVPDELAAPIGALMDQGAEAMRGALAAPRGAAPAA